MIRIKKGKGQSLVARTYSSSTDENVNPPPSFHHTLLFPLVFCTHGQKLTCLPQAVSSCSMDVCISLCMLCMFARECAFTYTVWDHLQRHTAAQSLIRFEQRCGVCTHVYCSSITIAVEVQSEYLCQLTAHLEALLHTVYVHTNILYLLYCTVRDEG